MHPDFWHQRWHEQRIGFHQDAPTPLLLAHWDALNVTHDARVFVPLAGKTRDMAWLAARGHRVLGGGRDQGLPMHDRDARGHEQRA